MSGTHEHTRPKTTFTADNPVPGRGQTGEHATGLGAKAEAAWEGVKAAVPGTDEHAEKRAHQADDPRTGERRTHATTVGAAVDQASSIKCETSNQPPNQPTTHRSRLVQKSQAWTDVKSKVGGTQTHTTTGTTERSYEDRSADL